MIKIIIILLLASCCNLKLDAQTYNSLLLFNFKIPTTTNYGTVAFNAHSYSLPLELMFIKKTKNNSALRIGANLISSYIVYPGLPGYKIADTLYGTYTAVDAYVPRISLGKEWRKFLHKDVYLITGADGSIGAMLNRVDSVFTESYLNNTASFFNTTTINSTFASNQKVMCTSTELKPFIGLRTMWGRLTMAYQFSLPIQVFRVFDTHTSFTPFQQINIGYGFNRKAKTKL